MIKNDALQSQAWWAPQIVPPKQAPNILVIITDDAGFGVPSTFGGVIPTPAMDRVAVGSDTLTGVNDADYLPPFPLTAKLNKVSIKVDRPQFTPADEKRLIEAASKAGD